MIVPDRNYLVQCVGHGGSHIGDFIFYQNEVCFLSGTGNGSCEPHAIVAEGIDIPKELCPSYTREPVETSELSGPLRAWLTVRGVIK